MNEFINKFQKLKNMVVFAKEEANNRSIGLWSTETAKDLRKLEIELNSLLVLSSGNLTVEWSHMYDTYILV